MGGCVGRRKAGGVRLRAQLSLNAGLVQVAPGALGATYTEAARLRSMPSIS